MQCSSKCRRVEGWEDLDGDRRGVVEHDTRINEMRCLFNFWRERGEKRRDVVLAEASLSTAAERRDMVLVEVPIWCLSKYR